MKEAIEAAIERQARKLIERDNKTRFSSVKYRRKFRLRTGAEAEEGEHRSPLSWSLNPHFDPRYCIRHSKYLAKIIWQKILLRTYEVSPAILYKIPKDSGGYRDIMSFSIPDAAIANLFNRKLRDRNKNIQSAFCYSYRQDRGLFDAVIQLSSFLDHEKAYVVQFDFSKYFDSIKHEYIRFVLDRNFFVVSPTEKFIVDCFLQHRFAQAPAYKKGIFEQREIGVPQGSSLSLFLSNIAAHELDIHLEKINGAFVRFADDIVCVSYNHDDALFIVQKFKEHCHYSGITINYEKSPGIALLKPTAKRDKRLAFSNAGDIGRIKTIEDFDYIGHKFSRSFVGISSRGISRIKRRMSKIIYLHLLHNPRSRKLFSKKRVGGTFYDWDLVTCINELRRYINGGLSERSLREFLEKNERIRNFKGLMSFYPLVTSVDQFADLDGWLVGALRRAMHERSRVLHTNFGVKHEPLSDAKIIDGSWYNFKEGISLETNAPSFVLAWRAARKSYKQYGLLDFAEPKYYSMAEFGDF